MPIYYKGIYNVYIVVTHMSHVFAGRLFNRKWNQKKKWNVTFW